MGFGNFLSALVQRGREAELGQTTGTREGEAERFKRGRLAAEDTRQSELDELNRALVEAQTDRNKATAAKARRPTAPKTFAPRNPNEISKLLNDRTDTLFTGAMSNPDIQAQAETLGIPVEEVAVQVVMQGVQDDPILGEHARGESPRVNQRTIRAAVERFKRANKPSAQEAAAASIVEALQNMGGGGGGLGGAIEPGGAPQPDVDTDLLGEPGVLGIDPSTSKTIVSAAKKAELEAANLWDDEFYMVGSP